MAAEVRRKPGPVLSPGTLDAVELRDRLATGALRAVELAEACLDRVRGVDAQVQAWEFLDPDFVMKQAEKLDRQRTAGRPIGPLHGLPVGVKDIIDTADMPTANGTPIDAGRRPRKDAFVAARLRAAGALVMGKTVTTEMAYFHPGKTRNPHDPARTPGGSSSGSAAAVASGMVPLAIGTQTAGSVIRPAAFCGTVGFKPTFGLIPRTGILPVSSDLDTVGAYAATVEGAALLAEALQGHDPADPDTSPQAPHRLLDDCRSRPPLTPVLALVHEPAWPTAEPTTHEAFRELREALGEQCDEIDLPDIFANGAAAQETCMLTGFARNFRSYYERDRDALSPRMRAGIEEGRRISAADYLSARDWREVLNAGLERIFDRYDAIVTPAAAGEAPMGEATGDPAFCRLWTLCGTPSVTLPLLTGPAGMPMGVQLVGRRGQDGRLLRTARWLIEQLRETAGEQA
ncbi:MAG TPA: amidase [Paracoccaceae bacterium]|nr:amidase [Paracoccaceae bacterium]